MIVTLLFAMISVVDISRCESQIRMLAAEQNHQSLRSLFIEAYQALLTSMPMEELNELKLNPLKIPQARLLTSSTSYTPILANLISIVSRSPTAELNTESLIPLLRNIIEIDISKKKTREQKHNLEKLSHSTNLLNQIIQASSEAIMVLAISPDGKTVYANHHQHTFAGWDAVTGEMLKTAGGSDLIFIGHSGPLRGLGLNKDGTMIFSGAVDGRVIAWSTLTGEIYKDENQKRLMTKANTEGIQSLTFSHKHKIIYAGTNYGNIFGLDRNLDFLSGEWKSFKKHNEFVNHLVLSPDEEVLYSGSNDETAGLLNSQTGTYLKGSNGYLSIRDVIQGIAVHPDQDILYIADRAGNIFQFNSKTGNKYSKNSSTQKSISELHGKSIYAITMSPNGRILAATAANNIHFLDTESELFLKDSQGNLLTMQGGKDFFSKLVFNPNGKVLYSGDDAGKLRIWILEDYLPAEYLEATP